MFEKALNELLQKIADINKNIDMLHDLKSRRLGYLHIDIDSLIKYLEDLKRRYGDEYDAVYQNTLDEADFLVQALEIENNFLENND